MSADRPTVSPQLIAGLIESTPDRVRRRLDRTPDVAASWDWQAGAENWSVHTGAETVVLPRGHVSILSQVSCTCLLSPHCFHVLACLSRLEVALRRDEDAPSSVAEETAQVESAVDGDLVEPTGKQRHAAGELVRNLSQMLRVGAANSGVVVQSGMLRAVHQCRAEGLHRLAALGLRVIAGASQLRARAAESDPAQLAEDVAAALETSRYLLGERPVAGYWIGTARRQQVPVRPRKLHGLLAEPVMARSGYAGAAVYFLGEDERIYTASDVRPGDAQLARDTYLGGIEIGPLIQPAKQLARGVYLGTDLTASQDGRLGRGKGVKIVEQGRSTWQGEAIRGRFQRPLSEQWHAVYATASLPADARPAGWDLIFLTGVVIGAAGPELILHLNVAEQVLRLAIENESESLPFRENLRMLAHAPGLRLQLIARVTPDDPTVASPLAVSQIEEGRQDNEPRLDLPDSLAGRVCLGFDEIQRRYLINAQDRAIDLRPPETSDRNDPLAPLRRRWIATMLSGSVRGCQGNKSAVTAETAWLNRNGFTTGAALLDALARTPSEGGPTVTDAFLAAALYLRSCRRELARSRTTQETGTMPASPF